jgi:hypothetical protein
MREQAKTLELRSGLPSEEELDGFVASLKRKEEAYLRRSILHRIPVAGYLNTYLHLVEENEASSDRISKALLISEEIDLIVDGETKNHIFRTVPVKKRKAYDKSACESAVECIFAQHPGCIMLSEAWPADSKMWTSCSKTRLRELLKKGYKVFFPTSLSFPFHEVQIIVINDYQSRPEKLKPVGTKSAFKFHEKFVLYDWYLKRFYKYPARYNLTIVSREQVLSELQAKEESKKGTK